MRQMQSAMKFYMDVSYDLVGCPDGGSPATEGGRVRTCTVAPDSCPSTHACLTASTAQFAPGTFAASAGAFSNVCCPKKGK